MAAAQETSSLQSVKLEEFFFETKELFLRKIQTDHIVWGQRKEAPPSPPLGSHLLLVQAPVSCKI